MSADDPFTKLLRCAAADPNAIDSLLAAASDELRQGQLRQSGRHRSAHHVSGNFRCHALERRLLLAAIRWDGGGTASNRSNPANWAGEALPGPAGDVSISVPGAPSVRLAVGTQSINTLTSDEPVSISGGTLIAAGDSLFAGTFALLFGTFTGVGIMRLSAPTGAALPVISTRGRREQHG